MPRPRFFKARPEFQEAVHAAAIHEFAKNGYEGASLNQILAAANLSKGAFYYYFDDKADLAADVLRRAYDEIAAAPGGLAVPRNADDFWKSICLIQRRGIETMSRSRDTAEAVARIAVASQRDSQLATLIAPVVREATAAGLRAWRRGQALGAVRRDIDVRVLMALVQAIKETLLRTQLPAGRPVRAREVDKTARLILDMIRRLCEPRTRRSSKERSRRKLPA